MSEKLMLIDGHSILNRAFYGLPDLTNAEGIHTNALYGFLNILFKFLDEEKPDYLAVAFDVSAPTFRHETFKEYKGTRKPMAAELKQQVPIIKDILKAMNIKTVEMPGFEADDILGTIAKKYAKEGVNVSIISGDRDLLQLCEDKIKIRIPKTKKGITEVEDYLPADVEAYTGVKPLEYIDVKALMGDSSDNIPGAPGVGPKTAAAIIQKYHSLENVFAHLDELTPPKARQSISDNMEQVKLSQFLARINIEAPVDFDLKDAAVGDFFNDNSYALYKKYNFKSLLKRFETCPSSSGPDIYQNFTIVEDFVTCEDVFFQAVNTVKDKKYIGLYVAYEDGIVGVSLCFSFQKIYYISCAGFISEEYISQKLTELSKACENERCILTLNLKEFLNAFDINDFDAVRSSNFADISIAQYLINPNGESYEADRLASETAGLTIPSKQELLGKLNLSQANMMSLDNLCKYVCLNSYIAYICWEGLKEKLISQNMYEVFENIEMPLVFVLLSMENEGIKVDKDGLKEYSEVLGRKIDVLEKEIYLQAGEEFNINSPKQLGVILFEKMGMPNGKKTKSGYSTAADVLDKLSEDYPFVKMILEYRQLTKLKSTYGDGLVQYIGNDGRIHGKFNQTITATGRISSTEPNLQNIPIRMEMGKKIRQVFVPKDDCVFVDADYSQIELRILAHMSGDEKLIEAYNMAEDIHRITASQVFNVPFEEVTDVQRRNAKAVNFGIIYGISSFGLSQDLSISKKEADEYINQYFKTYPDIKGFIDGLVESAKEKGYSLTLYNRRRPIPELKSSNFMQRSFGERVAMNAPIQGTAADIIKIAMINVYRELTERKFKSKLILQVHDELLVETYKDELEEVKKIVEKSMREAASLKVPLEVDLKSGNNWLEAH